MHQLHGRCDIEYTSLSYKGWQLKAGSSDLSVLIIVSSLTQPSVHALIEASTLGLSCLILTTLLRLSH